MLTTTNNKKVFVGDGSTTVFYYDFEVLKAEDIKCIVIDTDGNETELVYQTDYTVDLTNSSVSLSTPLRNGYTLVIYREVDLTQETEYPENSPFPAKSHERALDKLTMITQQLAEKVDRAIVKSISESGNITFAPLEPNKALVVNEDGNKIIMGPNADDIANAQVYAQQASDAADVVNSKFLVSGFDLDNPETMGVLSFDTATRTLNINPVNGQDKFTFWVKNVKYEKESDNIVIPDTSGLYYIYYDENGIIQQINANSITDKNSFFKNTLVATIYWNNTKQQAIVSDNRHGVKMDVDTRISMLLTEGARYSEGLNLNGLSDGSNTYSEISSGNIYAEDRLFGNSNATTQHKFLYRLGNEWVVSDIENNELAFKEDTATYYQYNHYNDTTNEWELVEGASDSDFWIMFVVAIPNINGSLDFYKIIGQNAYPNRASVRDAILTELQKLETDGLPFNEYVMLYSYIVKRNGKLVSLNDGSLFYDFRNLKGIGKTEDTLSAEDILEKLKTVDGEGSGLDADLVKGTDKNICTAWVNFNGYDGTIRDSYNISGVVRNDEGYYTIYFENEMNNSNYVIAGIGSRNSGSGAQGAIEAPEDLTKSTTEFTIFTTIVNSGTDRTRVDMGNVSIIIFGGK